MLKKLKLFMLADTKMKLLLIEAYIRLGEARLLKGISFSRTASILGEHMKETAFSMDDQHIQPIRQISQAIHLMSRHTFWESMCLVKAIAAMKMLEKRGIESTLYLGTAKNEKGKLAAHAWLRSGPFYITGAEEMEQFVAVSTFAKKIKFKG